METKNSLENLESLVEFGDGKVLMTPMYFNNIDIGALHLIMMDEEHDLNQSMSVNCDIIEDAKSKYKYTVLQFKNTDSLDNLIESLKDVKQLMQGDYDFEVVEGNSDVYSRK